MPAELTFLPGSTPSGFLKNDLTRYVEDSDTITRELIQNGLDAAVIGAQKDAAEIEFSLAQFRLAELPGYETYRRSFEAALDWRNRWQGELSSNEADVTKRIQAVLRSRHCWALLCRDNGVGLDQHSMNDLTGESNTEKGESRQDLGTSGVGHLTAFSASDLRYVLYAGRSRRNAELVDVGGGHAILAAYKSKSGDTYAADGFWMNPRGDLFERSSRNFPSEAPTVLKEELKRVSDTGTVVGILGFDFFRSRGESEARNRIANAAAINFLVAIFRKRLTVRVHGGNAGSDHVIDSESVNQLLQQLADVPMRQRKERLHPKFAFRASLTLRKGTQIEVPSVDGVDVWIRVLERGTREYSRVQLFRDGMWITNVAPRLEPSDFGDRQRFDAVVDVHSGRLHQLVRKSEGPEHRGIERHRITEDYTELRELMEEIAKAIRSAVPSIGSGQPVSPHDFAMIPSGEQLRAEEVPEYNPHATIGEQTVTDHSGEEEDENTERQNHHRKGRRRRRKRRLPRENRGFRLPHILFDRLLSRTVRSNRFELLYVCLLRMLLSEQSK